MLTWKLGLLISLQFKKQEKETIFKTLEQKTLNVFVVILL